MARDEILILGGYVQTSGYRERVFNNLEKDNVDVPKNIAKATGILPNHISMVLSELKKKDLVECINEDARKGRLYRLTPLGAEVKEYINTKIRR